MRARWNALFEHAVGEDPDDIVGLRPVILHLDTGTTARGIDAVDVLIDGSTFVESAIRGAATRAVRKGGPAENIALRDIPSLLTTLLTPYVDRLRSCIIVIWAQETGLAGWVGDPLVEIHRGGTVVPLRPESEAPVRIASVSLQPNDRLVLGTSGAAQFLTPHELLETARADSPVLSIAQQATWLVALAESRSRVAEQVIIVRRRPRRTAGATNNATRRVTRLTPAILAAATAPARQVKRLGAAGGSRVSQIKIARPRRRTRVVVPVKRASRLTLVTLLGAAVAVVVAGMTAAAIARPTSTAHTAAPLPSPRDLAVAGTQPSSAVLTWRKVPGASAYVVRIGSLHVQTTGTHLAVSQGLRPGGSYAWSVRALINGHIGPEAPAVHLQLPLPAPRLTVPSRLHAALESNNRVAFCWSGGTPTRLRVQGPHRYRLVRAIHTNAQTPRPCITTALPAGSHYKWRLAWVTDQGVKQRSPWHSLRIPKAHSRTHGVRVSHHRAQRRRVRHAARSVNHSAPIQVAAPGRVVAVQPSRSIAPTVAPAPATQSRPAPVVAAQPAYQNPTPVPVQPRAQAPVQQPVVRQPVTQPKPVQQQPAAQPKPVQPATQPQRPVVVQPPAQPPPAPVVVPTPQPQPTVVIACPTPPNCS